MWLPLIIFGLIGKIRAAEYIVVLNQGVSFLSESFNNYDISVTNTFAIPPEAAWRPSNDSFVGFSAYIPEYQLARLKEDKDVAYVILDKKVWIDSSWQYFVTGSKISAIQQNAPWNLARLSSRNHIKRPFSYSYGYRAGRGVNVYVVDTGISPQDPEFILNTVSRATLGVSFVKTEPNTDLNGHGTHVSGIIGSKTWGVAKNTNIIGVKVMDKSGGGSWSSIIAGLDWVVRDSRQKNSPSIINLSISGNNYPPGDAAVKACAAAGIHIVIAAGNNNGDACLNSPAQTSFSSTAITVGSSNINDKGSSFSNFGKCVSIFAPGETITSTAPNNQIKVMSGTSMASPHVAGLAAHILSYNALNTSELKDFLLKTATNDILSETKNTVNKLAFNEYQI